MEDSVGYLRETRMYQRLVVFIYDDSASVQEHAITSNALELLPNVEGVVIVSRPSQLPIAPQQHKQPASSVECASYLSPDLPGMPGRVSAKMTPEGEN